MRRTEVFRKQHAEILELVGRVAAQRDPVRLTKDANDARKLLSELAGVVKLHLSLEDRDWCPQLLKQPRAGVKETAQRFIDEIGQIKDAFAEYKEYNKRWLLASTFQGNPAGFIQETKGLCAALGSRIEWEDNQLYPMADALA